MPERRFCEEKSRSKKKKGWINKSQLIDAKTKIESLKCNIDQVRQRVSYWKEKCNKLQKKSSEEKELEFNTEIE